MYNKSNILEERKTDKSQETINAMRKLKIPGFWLLSYDPIGHGHDILPEEMCRGNVPTIEKDGQQDKEGKGKGSLPTTSPRTRFVDFGRPLILHI